MWEEINNQIPLYAAVLYVTLIIIELVLDLRARSHVYKLKDTLCSLTMMTFYVGNRALMKGTTVAILLLVQQFAFYDMGTTLLAFFGCYLVVDFLFYWYHRLIHEIRFGWAAHVAHHSSKEFNLGGTALRQSFAEAFMEAFFYAPVVLMGFDTMMVLAALELNLAYMFWVHTRKIGKLHPAFEFLMSTPSHHRVHHACNIPYLDKNYGGTFIIWDRMFGSFQEEKEDPVFGIPEQLDSYNPIWASIHGWVELAQDVWHAKGWRNKIGYMVMPPGWAPDGKGMTTRQKQAAYKREQAEGQG